ncbi:hypothetical protein ACFTZB_33565 [Rhodococcus sp. NPDC057014]|uniref:UGSC family (seleno)protein n=1 Tax=Rhodococcus sp. NPDC057014 TaxID=3346000 RepID=UPI00363C47B6
MSVVDSPSRDVAVSDYLTLIDPRGKAADGDGVAVSGLPSLQGKRLAVVTQGGWRSWTYYRERLEAYLDGPGKEIEHRRWQDDRPYLPERYDEIASSVDAAVIGLGNCGSCTNSVATAAAELAARGLPVVVIVTAGFQTLAEKTLQYKKQAHVPVISLPAAYEVMTEDEIISIADERVADVEAALTQLASS